MAFCSACGAQVPDGTTVCPACRAKASTVAAPATGGAMADNVAGMLAYITIVPAIVFLVMEPYSKNRFVRFHAFQNIFFCVALIALSIALSIVAMIPVLGWITLLLWPFVGLGGLIVWIVLLLKANQGQMWKLPVIGDLAEKQANA